MIEIYGGPHDGNVYTTRIKQGATIFLTPIGNLHTKPKAGDEAHVEVGICGGCGARRGPKTKARLFSPLSMPADPCQLCGATPEEQYDHHRD